MGLCLSLVSQVEPLNSSQTHKYSGPLLRFIHVKGRMIRIIRPLIIQPSVKYLTAHPFLQYSSRSLRYFWYKELI